MMRVLIVSVAVVFMFPAQAANKAPKDFWLRLEFGCAGTDILDAILRPFLAMGSVKQLRGGGVCI